MKFQHKLVATIDKYVSTNTLPRTLLLEGEWGCGKHTLAQYIADSKNLPLQDITESLTLDTIERIMLSPTPNVYLIDGSVISMKEQNIILKFLEEPLKNAYVILLVENKASLLNTVINRCQCLRFEQYTDEELQSFVEDTSGWTGEMFDYANTPGRILLFCQEPIVEMIDFAKKVLTQVKVAQYSNILTIPNRINFKDKTELFDFSLFSYILVNTANSLYCEGVIPYNACITTSQFYDDTKIPHINKQHLFEHYLIELKRVYERGA